MPPSDAGPAACLWSCKPATDPRGASMHPQALPCGAYPSRLRLTAVGVFRTSCLAPPPTKVIVRESRSRVVRGHRTNAWSGVTAGSGPVTSLCERSRTKLTVEEDDVLPCSCLPEGPTVLISEKLLTWFHISMLPWHEHAHLVRPYSGSLVCMSVRVDRRCPPREVSMVSTNYPGWEGTNTVAWTIQQRCIDNCT